MLIEPMKVEDRTKVSIAIGQTYLDGKGVADCFAICLDLMSMVLSSISPQDNQQLKMSLILKKYADGIVQSITDGLTPIGHA